MKAVVAVKAVRGRLSRKPVLHFLHIPKTGGTAIKAALVHHEFRGRYALDLGTHKLTLADVPPGEAFFFVVRDPAARFVSAFYSRQRRGRPRYDVAWTADEARVFGRFETANALAEALTSAEPSTQEAAVAGMHSVGHFDSYSRWLGGVEELQARSGDIVAALRQESLTSDFAAVCQIIGLDVTMPTDDVGAHRNPAVVDRSLSPLAAANLRQWYATDYAITDACRAFAPGEGDSRAQSR